MPPRILSRVWLACILCVAADPGIGSAGASGGGAPLTLEAAIVRALVGSRAAIVARLGRDEQKFALKSAEERYDPTIDLGAATTTRSSGDRTTDVSIGLSLPVRTGGSFRLSVRKLLAGERDRATSTELGFSQPLLKGFGPDIDTAPLRRAYLRQRIAVRAFRDRAAGIVELSVSAASRPIV